MILFRYFVSPVVFLLIIMFFTDKSYASILDSIQPPDNVHDYATCVMWMKQNQGRIANTMCRERFNWLVCEGAGFVAENFLGQDTICEWCRRMYPEGSQNRTIVAQHGNNQRPEVRQGTGNNCTGNCFNGSGKGEWMGKVYVGRWQNAKPQGKGTLLRDFYDNNSKVYSGYWREGEYNGYGTIYGDNGNIKYKGSFRNNSYHGKGALYFDNGKKKYVGSWRNGVKHGRGTVYFPSGRISYRGSFLDGAREGYGLEYSENKLLYRGYFKRDVYNGKGRLYHDNGNISYNGLWTNGVKNGSGTDYDERGKIAYKGNFIDGVRSDIGVLYHNNGRVKYRGTFVFGSPSGEGVWYNENGRKIQQNPRRTMIVQQRNPIQHNRTESSESNGSLKNVLKNPGCWVNIAWFGTFGIIALCCLL